MTYPDASDERAWRDHLHSQVQTSTTSPAGDESDTPALVARLVEMLMRQPRAHWSVQMNTLYVTDLRDYNHWSVPLGPTIGAQTRAMLLRDAIDHFERNP